MLSGVHGETSSSRFLSTTKIGTALLVYHVSKTGFPGTNSTELQVLLKVELQREVKEAGNLEVWVVEWKKVLEFEKKEQSPPSLSLLGQGRIKRWPVS